MNIYFWIIVAALLLEFFLYTLSRFLDLKNLSTDLPVEFKGYYSEDEYFRSQEYLRENTRFAYLTSSFNLLVIFLVIFLGFLIQQICGSGVLVFLLSLQGFYFSDFYFLFRILSVLLSRYIALLLLKKSMVLIKQLRKLMLWIKLRVIFF